MLHEEVIRLELACLDKRKLVKNDLTENYERDDEVFQDSARFLNCYGRHWIHSKGVDVICSRFFLFNL